MSQIETPPVPATLPTTAPSRSAAVGTAIPVRLERRALPFVPPFEAWRTMRDWLGDGQAWLLESLAGPETDRRRAMVGFDRLATIELRRTRLSIHGRPDLVTILGELVGGPAAGQDRSRRDLDLDRLDRVWDVLRLIASAFAVDDPDAPAAPGYGFGFFGCLGYDAVHCVEDLPYTIPPAGEGPDISLSLYRGALLYDLDRETCTLVGAGSPLWSAPDAEAIAGRLAAVPDTPADAPAPEVPRPRRVADSTTRERYLADVGTALRYIAIGDIYQVQLGHEIAIDSAAAPETVYARLRARNPAPYMVLAPVGDTTLVGASPEVFVRIEGDLVTMRPLAGTVPRSPDGNDDARIAGLLADPKEIAEHVMLVDLCRNDIGRICRRGSLDVDTLMAAERYSHVIHMVSNVTGRVRADRDAWDVIAATFPAGTMTGAPKIRAMEIIEELESSRRGVYAGTFGVIDFSGFTNLALCIRTAAHAGGRYRIRASAGIVADSVPDSEWRETLAKMAAGYWAITGEEIGS